MVTNTITVPIMHKDITFLDDVAAATRQMVLKFVKDWNSKDEWINITTSGSTGKPKAIKLEKSKMKASALATVNYFGLKPNQMLLLALPVNYIAGKMMLIRALEHGLKIIVSPINNNPLNKKIPFKIDFAAFVPLQVQSILNDEKSRKIYASINNVIIGGSVINQQLEQDIQSLSNNNYATFGMTETISHIALRNISKKEQFYTALPNVFFSESINNCLIINAPYVCDKKIITTDSIELLSDKQFIWKGRADFVINSGGIKLHPEEIEKKILPHLPTNRFYVIGIDDEKLGKKLVLKIEGDSTIKLSDLTDVLSRFELPKQIIFLDKFEQTETGKIKRV